MIPKAELSLWLSVLSVLLALHATAVAVLYLLLGILLGRALDDRRP